ncbi:MAG: DUF1996 domain-containing protein [Granulosicoccus sp.]
MNILRTAVLSSVLSVVFCITDSVAATLPLLSGQWSLVSLPGDSGYQPISNTLVSEELPEEDYGSTWIIYTFDADAGVYSVAPVTGSVPTGEGFWIQQITGTDVNVELQMLPISTLAPSGAGCSDPYGCFAVNVKSPDVPQSWHLAGAVSDVEQSMSDVGFFQDQAGLGCEDGCSIEEALGSGTVIAMWRYDFTSRAYVRIDENSVVQPGQGLWIRTRPGLSNARMLVPASGDNRISTERNLELLKSSETRNTQFDGNRFYNVPANQIAVSDLTLNYDAYSEALLPTDTSGYFRVKCEVSHFAYDDPIVFPNQPGRAHLHMFFGNTNANAYSTFDSLLNSGTGTCNGQDLNRTAYWVPAMLDSQGNALIPDQVMVYYKNDNFLLNNANELVSPFPDNLQMISGNGSSTTAQDQYSGDWMAQPIISFSCGPAYRSNDRRQPLIPDCYGSDQLEMQIAFPQCVDESLGYQSDQSHISYSVNGYYGSSCPDSHPTDISSIMYRIFFRPDQYGGELTGLHLSSDVKMDRILPGGTTAHADWFGAWHPDAMDMWIENCNNTQEDCETGLLSRYPPVSLIPRERNFYAGNYRAPATELIKLCPGKTFNPEDPLRSVAMCRMNP